MLPRKTPLTFDPPVYATLLDHAATPEQLPLLGVLELDVDVLVVVVVVLVVVVDVVVEDDGGTAAPPHALITCQSPVKEGFGTSDAYHLACQM
jgi:hypothetical protein